MATELTDSIPNLLYSQTSETKFGGYKPSLLLDPLPPLAANFLLCSKCHSILRNACTDLSLGKFLCEECTEDKLISPTTPSRTTISELKVTCPLVSRGCEWHGVMGGVEEHVISCPFYKIECRNKCGCVLMRQDMEEHFIMECVLREIECEFCGSQFPEKQMNEHFNCCTEFQVDCPQCFVKIKRSLIESHIQKVCEYTTLLCEYSKYGCSVKVKRKEMGQHLDENKISHLEMNVAGLREELLAQGIVIGLLQVRDLEKNDIIGEMKDRLSKIEINSIINPNTFKFDISGVSSIFQDLNSTVFQIFQGCFGYYGILVSCYVSNGQNLNLAIQTIQSDRDDELEWPLKANSQVSLIPCIRTRNEYRVKEENNILLNRPVSISDDSPVVIASIGKSYAMGPGFNEKDSIRVRVNLQTSNLLLKRKPQYFC